MQQLKNNTNFKYKENNLGGKNGKFEDNRLHVYSSYDKNDLKNITYVEAVDKILVSSMSNGIVTRKMKRLSHDLRGVTSRAISGHRQNYVSAERRRDEVSLLFACHILKEKGIGIILTEISAIPQHYT